MLVVVRRGSWPRVEVKKGGGSLRMAYKSVYAFLVVDTKKRVSL